VWQGGGVNEPQLVLARRDLPIRDRAAKLNVRPR